MATWQDNLDRRTRSWCVVARIEGVGRRVTNAEQASGTTDGRYRFCSVRAPDYASAEPEDLWRPLIAELPDVVSAQLPAGGGVAADEASATLVLADIDGWLTTLLQLDAGPVTTLVVDDATSTTVIAEDASRISATDVLYVDGEAMRVTAVPGSSGSDSVDVERGYLSTPATPHPLGSYVYLVPPFLAGRRLELRLGPLDADDEDEFELVGEYVVSGVSWSEELGAWVLQCDAEVQALAQVIPARPREAEGSNALAGRREYEATLGLSRPVLPASWYDGDLVHLQMGDDGEVVRGEAKTQQILVVPVDGRGVCGTERDDLPAEPEQYRLVMAADERSSDFRYSPPTESEDRTTGTWTQVWDPVSIMLCVLTSSADPNDGLELTNYVAGRGNYSSLPSGYGAGYDATRIDWTSFDDVQARLPDVRLYNLVLGRGNAMSARDWLDEQILRPLRLHLVTVGDQVRLVRIRAPLAGQSLPSIDTDDILMRDGAPLPDLSLSRDQDIQAKRVRYSIGPHEVTTETVVANPTRSRRTVEVSVPGGTAEGDQRPIWDAIARSAARDLYRPRAIADVAVDAALWAVQVGDLASMTVPVAPDVAQGVRGWAGKVVQCVYREPRLDLERGVWLQDSLRVYNDGELARAIAPAAWVTSVSGNTATCKPNRYTESDATGGLPKTDVGAFSVDDVVRLINPDGTAADPGVETVASIDEVSHTLALSGDFSGALSTGTVIVAADYDDGTTSQQGRLAYLADGDNRVGTDDGEPTTWEEA